MLGFGVLRLGPARTAILFLESAKDRQFVARFALIIEGPRLRNADVCGGAFFLYCFYVTTARAVKYVELR